jgi:hypothetical protein
MFKSLLKTPDNGVMIGLAEAAAVYVIYQSALPSHVDIRSAAPHDGDVESARKAAAWKSAAILGVVFLVTHDLNAFLVGGAALAGIDLMVKHANAVNPATGKLTPGSAVSSADNVGAFPLPDYSDPTDVQY